MEEVGGTKAGAPRPKPPCPSLLSPTARLPFQSGSCTASTEVNSGARSGVRLGAELRPELGHLSAISVRLDARVRQSECDGVRMLDEAEPCRRLHSCSWRQGGPRGRELPWRRPGPAPCPPLCKLVLRVGGRAPLLPATAIFSLKVLREVMTLTDVLLNVYCTML